MKLLAYLKMEQMKMKDFWKEEKGAADIVAVILIVLVAVAAAWIFREQILNLINDLFDQINIEGFGKTEMRILKL